MRYVIYCIGIVILALMYGCDNEYLVPKAVFTVKFNTIGDKGINHVKSSGRILGSSGIYSEEKKELSINVHYVDLNPCIFLVDFTYIPRPFEVKATYTKTNENYIITEVTLNVALLVLKDRVFK